LSIPEFIDGYYLPPGIHKCTIAEVEKKLACSSETRKKVWKCFKRSLERFLEIGLIPVKILINGSFVTGRKEPGDVDSVFWVPPDIIIKAITNVDDKHDYSAILILTNARNSDLIRDIFGAHCVVVSTEQDLEEWSKFFRCGGANGLRTPDPQKDPPWVKKPNEKGILIIENFKEEEYHD